MNSGSHDICNMLFSAQNPLNWLPKIVLTIITNLLRELILISIADKYVTTPPASSTVKNVSRLPVKPSTIPKHNGEKEPIPSPNKSSNASADENPAFSGRPYSPALRHLRF